MKSFAERFDEMLVFTGLTPYKLAKELETSSSVISTIRAGKNKPSFDLLAKLVSKYDILDINYLLTGKGKLLLKNANTPPDKSQKDGSTAQNQHETPVGNGTKSHPNPHATPHPTVKNEGKTGYKPLPEERGKQAVYGVHLPSIVTVNEHGIDNIIYVPVKAQAGYLVGYGDPEFIETLPSFRMPGLGNGTYRMFEVEGVSMSPTFSDKDRVIGQFIGSVDEIRENRVHVMVLKDGICIKRVMNRTKERGKIYLKSDTLTHRHDYPIREITPDEIIEMWYVNMKISGDLSEPSEVYSRIADLEINQLEILKVLNIKQTKINPPRKNDI